MSAPAILLGRLPEAWAPVAERREGSTTRARGPSAHLSRQGYSYADMDSRAPRTTYALAIDWELRRREVEDRLIGAIDARAGNSERAERRDRVAARPSRAPTGLRRRIPFVPAPRAATAEVGSQPVQRGGHGRAEQRSTTARGPKPSPRGARAPRRST